MRRTVRGRRGGRTQAQEGGLEGEEGERQPQGAAQTVHHELQRRVPCHDPERRLAWGPGQPCGGRRPGGNLVALGSAFERNTQQRHDRA